MDLKKYTIFIIFIFIFKLESINKKLEIKFNNKLENINKKYLEQIDKDFKKIKRKKINIKNLKKILDFGSGKEYMFYSIFNNKVNILGNLNNCYLDRYNAFNKALNDLKEIINLPDLEFIVCFNDCDLNYNYKVPIFAFCKNIKRDKNVILLPDSQSLDLAQSKILKKVKRYNLENIWENKIGKAFWRGGTSGGFYSINNYFDYPRFKLINLSVNYKDILDAKFTQIIQTLDNKVNEKLLNYLEENRSIEDHIRYKYQILIDGNSSTWGGSLWRFLANSLVLKQDSDYILWYYNCLKAYKHYVPFNNDCSDLVEKIYWAKNNDILVKEIVNKANDFAYKNLTYTDMLLYIYKAFIKYKENIIIEN